MKTKLLLFAVLTLVAVKKTIAQSADEEAIKQTARMETETAMKGDTPAWQSFFVHDENTTITYSGNGYNNNFIGWKTINTVLIPYIQSNPSTEKYNFINTNFIVNQSGNLATVQYDQIFVKGLDTTSLQREYRAMVKDNNSWKIVSLLAVNTRSYTSGDSASVENALNGTGYALLAAKKYKDAIEVFKLNVKLFPGSWNVYDSLGEAYADDGNKDDAIKNYEMSVKINPKNDNGNQWLEKLKKK